MRSKLEEEGLCKEKKTQQRKKATVTFNEVREGIALVNQEQDFFTKEQCENITEILAIKIITVNIKMQLKI